MYFLVQARHPIKDAWYLLWAADEEEIVKNMSFFVETDKLMSEPLVKSDELYEEKRVLLLNSFIRREQMAFPSTTSWNGFWISFVMLPWQSLQIYVGFLLQNIIYVIGLIIISLEGE